jgi:hypothetical protein
LRIVYVGGSDGCPVRDRMQDGPRHRGLLLVRPKAIVRATCRSAARVLEVRAGRGSTGRSGRATR